MKFSIELKILISVILVGVVMWLIFSLGDTPDKVINNVFLSNGKANIEDVDPIYTNAMINANTYGLVNKRIPVSEIPQLFFSTYIDQKVQSLKIIKQESLDATEIAKIFSNYTFVNSSTLMVMKNLGIESTNATALNSNFQNYNIASIQSMLQAREKIPQFAAFNYTIEAQLSSGARNTFHVIVMRAISSATGEPYKHLRWVVSYIY